MNIREALREATTLLNKYSSTPDIDAEVLFCHTLNITREKLFQIYDQIITPSNYKQFQKLINRRKNHEPIAYIVNHREFYGLDFYVDKRVLIPRPETEIIIDEVLKIIKKDASVVDIGTGSGCIPISLAKNFPDANYFAIEKSRKALEITKINIEKFKLENKIKLFRGNLLKPLPEKVDIIIANLPYLTNKQIKETKNSVKNYEPRKALFSGKSEVILYEKLFKQVPEYLNKNGYIFLEIGPGFSDQIVKLTKKHFPNAQYKIKKDLAEKDRIIIIKIKKAQR